MKSSAKCKKRHPAHAISVMSSILMSIQCFYQTAGSIKAISEHQRRQTAGTFELHSFSMTKINIGRIQQPSTSMCLHLGHLATHYPLKCLDETCIHEFEALKCIILL